MYKEIQPTHEKHSVYTPTGTRIGAFNSALLGQIFFTSDT